MQEELSHADLMSALDTLIPSMYPLLSLVPNESTTQPTVPVKRRPGRPPGAKNKYPRKKSVTRKRQSQKTTQTGEPGSTKRIKSGGCPEPIISPHNVMLCSRENVLAFIRHENEYRPAIKDWDPSELPFFYTTYAVPFGGPSLGRNKNGDVIINRLLLPLPVYLVFGLSTQQEPKAEQCVFRTIRCWVLDVSSDFKPIQIYVPRVDNWFEFDTSEGLTTLAKVDRIRPLVFRDFPSVVRFLQSSFANCIYCPFPLQNVYIYSNTLVNADGTVESLYPPARTETESSLPREPLASETDRPAVSKEFLLPWGARANNKSGHLPSLLSYIGEQKKVIVCKPDIVRTYMCTFFNKPEGTLQRFSSGVGKKDETSSNKYTYSDTLHIDAVAKHIFDIYREQIKSSLVDMTDDEKETYLLKYYQQHCFYSHKAISNKFMTSLFKGTLRVDMPKLTKDDEKSLGALAIVSDPVYKIHPSESKVKLFVATVEEAKRKMFAYFTP